MAKGGINVGKSAPTGSSEPSYFLNDASRGDMRVSTGEREGCEESETSRGSTCSLSFGGATTSTLVIFP